MSDFTALFPARELLQVPQSFVQIRNDHLETLRANQVQIRMECGAPVMISRSLGGIPEFYVSENGLGWVVVKGIIFDTCSNNPKVDLKALLDQFLHGKSNDLNRYEGTFALAAWDTQSKQGWVVNDHASMLNLYYGENEQGLYVTTNALTLARALKLGLNPCSIQEFIARGVLLAPATMFTGLRRINVGEHIRYKDGRVLRDRHWYAYASPNQYRHVREAAEAFADTVVDRISRYAAVAKPIVFDLTGGYDTRLVVVAANAAMLDVAVTVNGPKTLSDVKIAREIADKMHWRLTHFDVESFWSVEVTPEIRRELLYRTNGEIPFTEVYHHYLSRPILAQNFQLHAAGSGGELLRYFPWSQEFFGIGRRRLANIDNVIKYRFLQTGVPPPRWLLSSNWLPLYRDRLWSQIEDICREVPNAITTQQLDAVYLWKMTGHSSLYLSSIYNWLPNAAPLLTKGIVDSAVAMPWKMRLTSRLQRQIIYHLSPVVAGVITAHGGNAEPTRLGNLHLSAWQFLKDATHFVSKMEKVWLKGVISRTWARSNVSAAATLGKVPFVTREFRNYLNPNTMFSRDLYNVEGLSQLLIGNDEHWYSRGSYITRLATVEALCRELQIKPERDFLTRQ